MTPHNGASFEGRSVESPKLAVEECNLPESNKKNIVAILGFEEVSDADEVEALLKARNADVQVLRLGSRSSKVTPKKVKRSIAWKDVMETGFTHELELLAVQSRTVG